MCLFIDPVDYYQYSGNQASGVCLNKEFCGAQEEEIRNLINALEECLQNKLDRDEFDQLREWLEKRFKALAVRVRSIHSVSPVMGVPPVTQITDEAAGLRRGLMQHYHCISCDRPLQIPTGLE
ncbi:uncharacterized protein DEA37_0013024 [Paragonimus westermani]|uniref:DUF4795 domain-containing protein n=1 Tax=Paragonimus westermani TaxID=34504 RepID=A0A5J4NUP6_9TREM|nr:uncharacterized protein DEA37_0013024 [Paragonimus westermani]